MEKKHLSDVLDTKTITQSAKRKFCILAGVGAGKNTFIEEELKGAGNILYISSRRAKVDEILTNEDCKEKIDWNKLCDDIVSTTNYGVEMMVKNEKFSGSGIREPLEHFDYIVVDEAHSLYTDSTYTDAPFHIIKLLDYVEKNYSRIKIVLMTGTPEPLMEYLNRNDYEIIDKRSECINVMPKHIEVIPLKTAVEYIRNLPDTQKTVYYSNSASGLVKGEKCLLNKITSNEKSETSHITKEEVTFCMSDKSIVKYKQYYKGLEEECLKLKKHIVEHKQLPNDKRILLTTATLREGINIIEDDVKIAFCESHVLTDIQQFAGRIRNGLDTLYIIEDAQQHIKTCDEMKFADMEVFLSCINNKKPSSNMIDHINYFFKGWVMNSDSSFLYNKKNYKKEDLELYKLFMDGNFSPYHAAGEACKVFIDLIEKKFNYIRLNNLTSEFEAYYSKYREERRLFANYSGKLWEERLSSFAKENNIIYAVNKRNFERYIDLDKLDAYLREQEGKIFENDNKRNELLETLRELLFLQPNCQAATISKRLKELGRPYELKMVQSKRGKRCWKLVKI